MKRILICMFLFAGLWSQVGHAQQELMVSQYMFNGLLLNPAYAGSHPYASVSLLHRSQWVKFDGAPRNQVLSFDTPIFNDKLGLGLLLTNDGLGITNELTINANVSYKVRLGKGNLSFGMRGALGVYSAKLSDITAWDAEQDPLYNGNDISGELVPKFGAGIYYYTPKFYVGAAIPTIFAGEDEIFNSPLSTDDDPFFTKHSYLNAGMVFEITESFALKPSFLIKREKAAPVETDINLNAYFNNTFSIGMGVRTGDAFVAMLEIFPTTNLRIGYAYDFTLTAINNYSNGSHEIILAYDFGGQVDIKTRSPRYF